MRFVLFLAVLLLPLLAQGQAGWNGSLPVCLSAATADNRVSGRVKYYSFRHPFRDVVISGYTLVLLTPRCYTHVSPNDGKDTRSEGITEVGLIDFWHSTFPEAANKLPKINGERESVSDYLADKVGQLVTVTGEMQDNLEIYYILAPQIVVSSIVPCEITPKPDTVQQCR